MKRHTLLSNLLFLATLSIVLFSCTKDDENPFPATNEAISFLNIDSAVVKAKAGSTLKVDVVLVTDKPIDSIKAAYFIDTLGVKENLTYAETETQLLATALDTVTNKIVYSASLKMPADAYGVRAFRPYLNNTGDYVRVVFRMEATPRVYEKQLKVIIEP